MCGIAGCYQQPDGRQLAETMGKRLAHRGPDAGGVYSHVCEGVAVHLAHRRLSIIDLSSAANQPFSKAGLVLVYNGELYNYRELRAELAAAGVRFTTASDTEVVLEAWRTWDRKALDRFRGMFAFALFDEVSGSLVLARDQLGIKPLYVLRRGEGVVFSSELKGLVAALGGELQVDHCALVASTLYYWVPDQRCAVRGVEKLPPGSVAVIEPGGPLRLETYWDIAAVARDAASRPRADLRTVVEESVSAHLVADVPVSSFLSGGIDSSIVTVLAKRANPEIDAYTIAFRSRDRRLEAMPDDVTYARKVASRYGVTLHEIEITPDIAELLPRMVEILDEPNGDPAAINTLLMCEAARAAGVRVLLSGMGADELFGGYRKHVACLAAARYRKLPRLLRQGLVRPGVSHLPVTAFGRGLRHVRWAKRFLTFAELEEEEAFRRSYTLYDTDELGALLNPDLKVHLGTLVEEHKKIYEDTSLGDQASRMCLADSRLFLPGLNLAYTDRASMAASTEVRVPFVDTEVFKAAFSLHGPERVDGRTGKAALKQAAEAWLPKEIVYRPKASFSAPLRAWMAHDLRPLIDEVLLSGKLVTSGFLDRSQLERLLDDERSGREDRSKQLWQLLSMELWTDHMARAGVAA